jgi:hypothetical protein
MVEYKIRESDIAAFRNVLKQAEKELGKTTESALKWGAINVMDTLAGATRVSAKTRPIVKNPSYDKKTSKPRDKWGVMRYKPKTNEEYFQPIYRFGNYGTYRIWNKSKGKWLTIDKDLGRRIKDSETLDDDTAKNDPVLMKSKKRKITRSGLAKKAWRWAQAHMYNAGTSVIMGVPNLMAVKVWGKGNNRAFRIDNKSRYAIAAMKGGERTVSYAMGKAARSMEHKIGLELKKRLAK